MREAGEDGAEYGGMLLGPIGLQVHLFCPIAVARLFGGAGHTPGKRPAGATYRIPNNSRIRMTSRMVPIVPLG